MLMVLLSFLTLSTYGAGGEEVRLMLFNCNRTVQSEIKFQVAFHLLATSPSDKEV